MAVDRAKERKVADSPELGRQDREVQEPWTISQEHHYVRPIKKLIIVSR